MSAKLILSIFVAGFFITVPFSGAAETITAEDIRKEIRELQEQIDETKRIYEEKISRLEAQIKEMERQAPVPATDTVADAYAAAASPKSSLANMPDVSFIGNIIGSFGEKQDNKVGLDGVEVVLGGYIFPNARADVILGAHKHGDHYETELEEAYVSFFNLPGGFGFQAGKKLLDFGKINSVHGHHYMFVDKPLATENYFGGHGMAGSGVSVNYLFPLPFFLQGSVGYWVLDHECEGEAHHSFAPADNAFNARLWSSFPVGNTGELEVGGSFLRAKGPHHADTPQDVDDIDIYGLDLTYSHAGVGFQRLLLRSELYFLNRKRFRPFDAGPPVKPEVDDKWSRQGLYSLLNYRFNQYWDAGARYDRYETPGRTKDSQEAYSLFATRSLTETTKLRGQASYHAEDNDWRFYIQLLFGIGPHAHPLE